MTISAKKHIIPALGNIPLPELKPPHLQHLYAEKQQSGLSNRTVQLIHVTLHKALKNAVKAGLLMRNIAEVVDVPKYQRPEFKIMSESDIHMFLKLAKETPYYELFYTYLFTGMRRSELLALRWGDVDLLFMQLSVRRTLQQLHKVPEDQRITFKEPKSKKSRRQIKLSPSNCLLLTHYIDKKNETRKQLGLNPVGDDDLVFCNINGSPYLPESVTHIWQKLAIKFGLKGIRLHDLRHSMASYMLRKGIHPKIVQQRLGHSSIAITLDIYSHVVPGLQEAAANSFDDLISNDESRLDREIKEIIK